MIEQGKILQQRYRIESRIGQGGMGAVYVATDGRFGTAVAIKETLCPDESYHKAIEREARLLNSLKHPALPRVSDHFIEENVQFLVMEYIPGEDLAAMLDRYGRPFPVKYVLNWADQLLDALNYLHGQQIPVIHRDIKPQNLKLTPQGQVILLDFGLAKGNPTDAGHHTAAKSLFGYSRNYAALEQIQGTGTDPRSDIYSLGATLYHLSTGRPPVDALTRAMRVLSRGQDPLVPAHQMRSDIPVGFSAVLNAAMDLDAGARPQSAAQMRNMLRGHEEYEYLAAAAGAPSQVAQSEVSFVTNGALDFETHVRQGPTQPQSSIATEVLPLHLSQATSVPAGLFSQTNLGETATRVAVETTSVPRSRRFAVAGALAAALLIAFVASAGALYYGPSALFGVGKAADVRQGQAAPGGGVPDSPESNGGAGAANPKSTTHDPTGQPAQPGEPVSPIELQSPDVPTLNPGPGDAKPGDPDTVRAKSPAPKPKENPQGRRVDTIEIDRLPGGVRGVKVTRERTKKPASGNKKDDSGFRVTKIPGIFKKAPSKLRIVPPKDRPKQ